MSARRPWAWPLVPLYAAGLVAKDSLRRVGLLKTRRLAWPVVSVGSISAGGAGKTPVVMALAELLRQRGWTADVLSRGCGRSGGDVELVLPDLEDAAERFGDEPVLMTRRTGVPVWVGAERFKAGQAAESATDGEGAARRLHLLDDGFQHQQLARKVDIVLVTEADLSDSLLPAGNLREPMRALRRADVVVVREDEQERILPRLRQILSTSTAFWTIQRVANFAEAEPVGRHLAFCGIARPEDFLRDLHGAGVSVADAVIFRDHHHYTMGDVDELNVAFDGCSATAFITTEKDAVKLSVKMRAKLEERGAVTVARLKASFIDENEVMRDLEARLR